MEQNNLLLKEGFKPLAIALALAVFSFLFICDTLGFIFLLVSIFIFYIHRNPIVGFVPKDENNIMSPIEGKISSIDYSKNNYKIYIDVSLCNGHVLRAPKTSAFSVKKIIHGLNLCHNTFKAKELNSRATLKFDDIKVKLLSGFCNKVITLEEEKQVLTSQRFGLFFHGLVMVEIPKSDYELNVEIGQKVQYETKLAKPFEK
jgi:phosphatidylserine decarboxylase